MRKQNQAFLCLTVVLNLVAVNAYSAVTILNTTSSARAWNDKGGSGTSVTWTSTVEPYNTYSAYAWQNTTISGNTIYANGGANEYGGGWDKEWFYQSASSFMTIEFNVSTPQYFLLDLNVDAVFDDHPGSGMADQTHLNISLIGDSGLIFCYDFYEAQTAAVPDWYFHWGDHFQDSYLLESGNYTLIAAASVGGSYGPHSDGTGGLRYGCFATYDLQLSSYSAPNFIPTDLNVIPAPGALLLAGTGVGCVSWLRRRRTL